MTNLNHEIVFRPIGVVRSPHAGTAGTPIQPSAAKGVSATVEIYPEFADGLKDLDGFSHIYLLCHFHKAGAFKLQVIPFLDDTPRGVFATRAPSRPNSVGLSIVRLERVDGLVLHIRDVDILDGTPVLDIKPYVPEFDQRDNVRCGWIQGKLQGLDKARDDGRFQ
jgi:tRNA-Thr(GGU) m(6)t(6)A37 methyltransferase TsaA